MKGLKNAKMNEIRMEKWKFFNLSCNLKVLKQKIFLKKKTLWLTDFAHKLFFSHSMLQKSVFIILSLYYSLIFSTPLSFTNYLFFSLTFSPSRSFSLFLALSPSLSDSPSFPVSLSLAECHITEISMVYSRRPTHTRVHKCSQRYSIRLHLSLSHPLLFLFLTLFLSLFNFFSPFLFLFLSFFVFPFFSLPLFFLHHLLLFLWVSSSFPLHI